MANQNDFRQPGIYPPRPISPGRSGSAPGKPSPPAYGWRRKQSKAYEPYRPDGLGYWNENPIRYPLPPQRSIPQPRVPLPPRRPMPIGQPPQPGAYPPQLEALARFIQGGMGQTQRNPATSALQMLQGNTGYGQAGMSPIIAIALSLLRGQLG